MNSSSSQESKEEEFSIQFQKNLVSQFEPVRSSPTNLQFDRLQTPDEIFTGDKKLEFGNFVAREAVLDEEYWTAAWLRAEAHWEDREKERYADSYKRKFAEQEFNTLKRHHKAQLGQRCTCIVAVKKEHGNQRHTVIKSVVGTLDLSIRHFLHGETFPGEKVKASLFCSIDRKSPIHRYGYVANLCVAKSARRQGIARNMLHFAITSAKSNGVEQVYVHVHRKNIAAQELYQKMGFEVVEMASSQLSEDNTFLLSYKR